MTRNALLHPNEFTALVEAASCLNVSLSPTQLGQFTRYRDELLAWNSRVNLTAITNPQEVLIKHFVDSLSCLLVLPLKERGQGALLDVGTGAGFPGLPLTICYPTWQTTLLDSVGKKTAFLNHLVRILELHSVRILTRRAEDLAQQPDERERYDVIVCRAVAALPVLLEYCLPLCRVGGLFIAQKKGNIDAELSQGQRAALLVGARFGSVIPVGISGLDDRCLVLFQKITPTERKYPRKAGIPAKKPLGGGMT